MIHLQVPIKQNRNISFYSNCHSCYTISQSPCPSVHPSVCPSVHTFVTDISASTGRNDFIFDIWLWHGDLFHVSPFQVYRTSISCLQCDLEFFMFAVMKTFVTIISASTGRNDFIFDIWLWHGDLYRVSPFQVYRTSTSCLLCDLQMNEWGYSQHDVVCNITSCFVSDGMTVFMETPDHVIFLSFLIRKNE